MRQTKVSLIAVVFGVFFWLLPSTADAAKPKTVTVACVNDAAKDQAAIDKALSKLKSGDTLSLTGTCKANVSRIPGGVTVDGGGDGLCGEVSGAKIEAADATRSTVSHGGSGNVTIKGLIIKGGGTGVSVAGVGEGTIRENNITGNTGSGISVNRESHARIINNCIENNGSNGISVNETSSARIGFLTGDDTTASPNTIQNNGNDGVHVTRSSSARIVGNTISGNTGDGVAVRKASHADISNNTINSNGEDGIEVSENSGVNLGENSGTGIFEAPNDTTANNTGFGIRCFINSYANGRRVNGTATPLNGGAGGQSFSGSCVESLDD